MVSVVGTPRQYSEGVVKLRATSTRLRILASKSSLESGRRLQLLRNWIQKASIQSRVKRHAELPVIVVAESDKAERLQTGALILARWIQHFSHAVDGAGARVESDFDEIAGGKFMLQLQQSAVDGDGLKFGARPLAALCNDCGSN
jgi:hypothetical protein